MHALLIVSVLMTAITVGCKSLQHQGGLSGENSSLSSGGKQICERTVYPNFAEAKRAALLDARAAVPSGSTHNFKLVPLTDQYGNKEKYPGTDNVIWTREYEYVSLADNSALVLQVHHVGHPAFQIPPI